jgi:hypothetical protein
MRSAPVNSALVLPLKVVPRSVFHQRPALESSFG